MRLKLSYITLLGLVILQTPAKANTDSCHSYALTNSEIKAVEIMEDMYAVQSKMSAKGNNLRDLNKKRGTGYNQYDSNSVNQYNEIVDKYNDIIKYQSKLSQEFSYLKNSYNTLITKISPSTNISLVNCLNSKLFQLESNLTSFNLDTLNLRTEALKINTENLRRKLEK